MKALVMFRNNILALTLVSVVFGLFFVVGSVSATSGTHCDCQLSASFVTSKDSPSACVYSLINALMPYNLGQEFTKKSWLKEYRIALLKTTPVGTKTIPWMLKCDQGILMVLADDKLNRFDVAGFGKENKEKFTFTKNNCNSFKPTGSFNKVKKKSNFTGSIVNISKVPIITHINVSCRLFNETVERKKIEEQIAAAKAASEASFRDLKNQAKSLNLLGLGGKDLPKLIGRVIKIIMGVVGSVALAMFIYGGLVWMTARGNAERAAMAIKILTWATLGIIVILSSYVLVDFVFKAFG